MRYEGPELLDRLAGEHVLGTLRGPARRRFERVCEVNVAARSALERWQDDWSALSLALDPVEPSPHVWDAVERRIRASAPTSPARSWWRTWQVGLAASLLALALIIGLMVREQLRPLPTLALLGPDSAHLIWRLERARGPELTSVTIRVVGPVQAVSGKDYELWALPKGGNPVSLGLLPGGGTLERKLTEPQRLALVAAEKVAVSVEPAGGSPTGLPTGPIIIVTNVLPVG